MSERAVRWYPSKVDAWLGLVLLFVPLVQIAVIVVSLVSGALPAAGIGAIALLLVGCLYSGCVLPMRYGLDEKWLSIRFGLCRSRVRIADIREVYRTRNPLSSPALSLDRLWIQHGTRWYQALMISPRDQEAFMSDLAQLAGLERTGRGWIRRVSS
jgi:hypothetical protein